MKGARRLSIAICCGLVLLVASADAGAQTVATSLRQLSLLVGERVEVTELDGLIAKGRLTEVSDSVLVVEGKREDSTVSGIRSRGHPTD